MQKMWWVGFLTSSTLSTLLEEKEDGSIADGSSVFKSHELCREIPLESDPSQDLFIFWFPGAVPNGILARPLAH